MSEEPYMIDLRWQTPHSPPYLVPVPRIPCVGEQLRGPDDSGTFTVTGVVYAYDRGFYFPPSSILVYVEAAEAE